MEDWKMSEQLYLDKAFFKQSLLDMAKLTEEQRDYWTSLDSDIGDGDHGVNLSIGFRGISAQMNDLYEETEDIHSLLKKSGMILLSKVGGASGPLYGSFFMKMGEDVAGKNQVSYPEFLGMIKNGIAAVQHRGKAQVGDKTMIDAFLPGLEVLETYQVEEDPYQFFEKFIEVMKKGAESTIPLVANKGRAMRLGERAIGHKDPGSESSWMLMDIFNKNLKVRSEV